MQSSAFVLQPDIAYNESELIAHLDKVFGGDPFVINKRSIDARSKKVKIRIEATRFPDGAPDVPNHVRDVDVTDAEEVCIVGSGPAGLFAAVELIQLGLKPVIIERGKDVQARRRDLANLNKNHEVHPDSNYCFGEGGAGTYSDGKLYTRSKKRGDVRRLLEMLVGFGAKSEILYDAHPHIGTNKLPKIIETVREYIRSCGGDILFDSRLVDILFAGNQIQGVRISGGQRINCRSVILATGHSARDIFELLAQHKIHIEAKPFALGIRVEHPQALIDKIQYRLADRGPYLPAAAYSLVAQAPFDKKDRGVFSFCMCPGGFIVPSATAPGEVVVNGMSPSRRDSRFANSGIVVAINEGDIEGEGPLKHMNFQRVIEQRACEVAGGTQSAPAQRLDDFVKGRLSPDLPACSYQPGLQSVQLTELLPEPFAERLRYGFKQFGKRMKGYYTNEAVLLGVESRTSSPVRIPRDPESLQHVQLHGLFPCGEGAGYAGGIVSAAVDGQNVARAVKHAIDAR